MIVLYLERFMNYGLTLEELKDDNWPVITIGLPGVALERFLGATLMHSMGKT
jgi:hypothetical protein